MIAAHYYYHAQMISFETLYVWYVDLTFYGVLMLAQKSASQFGDGEGALAMWKNSMADYHDEHKVDKILSYNFT